MKDHFKKREHQFLVQNKKRVPTSLLSVITLPLFLYYDRKKRRIYIKIFWPIYLGTGCLRCSFFDVVDLWIRILIIHADSCGPGSTSLQLGTLLNWLPGVSYRTGITRSWCMLPPTSWWRWPGQWGRPASGNSRSSPISTQVLAISGQPFIFSTFYSN